MGNEVLLRGKGYHAARSDGSRSLWWKPNSSKINTQLKRLPNPKRCLVCGPDPLRFEERRYLHDVEEHLLAQTVLSLKELVFRVGAGDIPSDELLARRGHLEQLRVLVFDGHVGGTAEQLPDDGAEVVGDPFADELLEKNEAKKPEKMGFEKMGKLLVDGEKLLVDGGTSPCPSTGKIMLQIFTAGLKYN